MHREREPHTTVGFVAKARMVKRSLGISGAELGGHQVIVELSPSIKCFASSCPCFISSIIRVCDPFLVSTHGAKDLLEIDGIVTVRRRLGVWQYYRGREVSSLGLPKFHAYSLDLHSVQKISQFSIVPPRQCAPICQSQMSLAPSPVPRTNWQSSEIVHTAACYMAIFLALGTSLRSIDAAPFVEIDVVSPTLIMSGILLDVQSVFRGQFPHLPIFYAYSPILHSAQKTSYNC